MRSKGDVLQIKIRDTVTGKEGWIDLPDLLSSISSVVIEQFKLEQEFEKALERENQSSVSKAKSAIKRIRDR